MADTTVSVSRERAIEHVAGLLFAAYYRAACGPFSSANLGDRELFRNRAATALDTLGLVDVATVRDLFERHFPDDTIASERFLFDLAQLGGR
jgi:hypothetical protein